MRPRRQMAMARANGEGGQHLGPDGWPCGSVVSMCTTTQPKVVRQPRAVAATSRFEIAVCRRLASTGRWLVFQCGVHWSQGSEPEHYLTRIVAPMIDRHGPKPAVPCQTGRDLQMGTVSRGRRSADVCEDKIQDRRDRCAAKALLPRRFPGIRRSLAEHRVPARGETDEMEGIQGWGNRRSSLLRRWCRCRISPLNHCMNRECATSTVARK